MNDETKPDDAKPKSAGEPLLEGLRSLDAAIRKTTGDPNPGSGLYALLSVAMSQLMGVQAPPPPVDKPVDNEPPKSAEPVKHEPPKPAPPPAARK